MAGVRWRPLLEAVFVALAFSAGVAVSRCGGSTDAPNAAQPTFVATPQCNESLWSHVYDPARLTVVDACKTVAGVITDHHDNEDGDIDVRLALDWHAVNANRPSKSNPESGRDHNSYRC